MMKKAFKHKPQGWSIMTASLHTRLTVAFALMTVIPMLTLGYFITTYLIPNVATRENMLLVILFAVVLALIGFVIMRRTMNALTAFRDYIRSVAEGDFEAHLAVRGGPEINSISESVHAIVEKLQRDREALDNYSRRLRGEARDRAAELERANEALLEKIEQQGHTERMLRDSHMQISDALQQMKGMQRRLVQQERLNALGQMASGMAHDFNNTLMPVVGLTKFLLDHPDELDDREELIDTLREIYQAADETRETVRRLKEFYKPVEDEEFGEMDLKAMVADAISMTQPRWKEEMAAKGVSIEIQTDFQDVPEIVGTELDLRDAVINLILNSVDAMPQGGTITMCLRADDKWAEVVVADMGAGMTEEVRRQCLEPFFTTKGMVGTGMGLSMAYGAVQRQGGHLEIESEAGKGTTVTIRLPMTTEKDEDGLGSVDISALFLPPMKVLVIDDDLWPRLLLEKYLSVDDHRVETAATGKEGLKKFRDGGFDCVITDRAMPDMSGDEVALEVKSQSPDTPVVMLTGFGDLMAMRNERPEGVDEIVSKPVTADELKLAMVKAMRRGGGRGNADLGARNAERGVSTRRDDRG